MPLCPRAAFVGAVILTLGAILVAQGPPGERPAFDIASIKVNHSGDRSSGGGAASGGRFSLRNVTTRQLITSAFGFVDQQVIGGPSWINETRFDIVARMPEGTYNAQTGATSNRAAVSMLKALLEDRFGLVVHHESRELTDISLVLARTDGKLGPRMTPSSPEDWDCQKRDTTEFNPSDPFNSVAPCGSVGGLSKDGGRRIVGRGLTVDEIAQRFGGQLGGGVFVLVRNETNLSGRFNIDVEYAPEPGGGSASADLPSIFTAVQEQLGLKIVMKKAPSDVVVIDHIERPTED